MVNPEGLSAFVACRLIPLDKCPGVRPIGISEIPGRTISKAILWILSHDIKEVSGGQIGGCEAAIHAHETRLQQPESRWGPFDRCTIPSTELLHHITYLYFAHYFVNTN